VFQVSYIGASLNAGNKQTWVLSSLTLPQAVLAPLFSSVSDVFQVRKSLMVGLIILSFIGAAIAPGSQTIYRLIGAQILISFGFSAAPLGYAIPSEILPRRWRPSKSDDKMHSRKLLLMAMQWDRYGST